jgi:hypothetical protein
MPARGPLRAGSVRNRNTSGSAAFRAYVSVGEWSAGACAQLPVRPPPIHVVPRLSGRPGSSSQAVGGADGRYGRSPEAQTVTRAVPPSGADQLFVLRASARRQSRTICSLPRCHRLCWFSSANAVDSRRLQKAQVGCRSPTRVANHGARSGASPTWCRASASPGSA